MTPLPPKNINIKGKIFKLYMQESWIMVHCNHVIICWTVDNPYVEFNQVILLLFGDTPRPPTHRAENAKINVTDEPYFGTQIVCNYLPFSKAAKGAQGGPQQYATFERKHSPTEK